MSNPINEISADEARERFSEATARIEDRTKRDLIRGNVYDVPPLAEPLRELGPLHAITYKGILAGDGPHYYEHVFADESAPTLAADDNDTLHIIGGSFDMTSRGITDRKPNPVESRSNPFEWDGKWHLLDPGIDRGGWESGEMWARALSDTGTRQSVTYDPEMQLWVALEEEVWMRGEESMIDQGTESHWSTKEEAMEALEPSPFENPAFEYPDYPFYLVEKSSGEILSGWDYREDAEEDIENVFELGYRKSDVSILTERGYERKHGEPRWASRGVRMNPRRGAMRRPNEPYKYVGRGKTGKLDTRRMQRDLYEWLDEVIDEYWKGHPRGEKTAKQRQYVTEEVLGMLQMKWEEIGRQEYLRERGLKETQYARPRAKTRRKRKNPRGSSPRRSPCPPPRIPRGHHMHPDGRLMRDEDMPGNVHPIGRNPRQGRRADSDERAAFALAKKITRTQLKALDLILTKESKGASSPKFGKGRQISAQTSNRLQEMGLADVGSGQTLISTRFGAMVADAKHSKKKSRGRR